MAASVRASLRPAAVERNLGAGDVSLSAIAESLGAGTRTLQRMLRAEGATFAGLPDDVRRRIAMKALADGTPRKQLAQALGFTQPAAFYRAFKRWTGESAASFAAHA